MEIEVDVTFDADIESLHRTDFGITKLSGSDIFGSWFFLSGPYSPDDPDSSVEEYYKFHVLPDEDTEGSFLVDIDGGVLPVGGTTVIPVEYIPVLIPYNDLKPVIQEVETPYRGEDDWWNILVVLEHPVMGFGIHSITTGIKHVDDIIYTAQTLDNRPEEVPPDFTDSDGVYPVPEGQHFVNGWEYTDLQNEYQGRYFWVKVKPDEDEDRIPEILLNPSDTQIKAVSYA